MLKIDRLRFPEELVFFKASKAEAVLLLNPELGAFASTPLQALLGAYAKGLGLRAGIITNATLITNIEVARRMKETFDDVTASLDGGSSETNDAHRGLGSFDRIVRGIRFLNEAGVRPMINSTISRVNVCGVEQLIEFVSSDLKVEGQRLVNVGYLGRDSNRKLPYTWETYMRTFEAIHRHMGREEVQIENVRSPRRQITLVPRKNCGMGAGEIYVDAQGNVYPCRLVTTKEWHAGNIRRKMLKEILAEAASLQRARNLSVRNQIGCRSCIIRWLCGGGCRGFHMGFTRNALLIRLSRRAAWCPSSYGTGLID